MNTMNAPARNLTLLMFGAAIGIAAATGTYLNYVRPVMFWFLVASAGVIVLLALSGMASDVADARNGDAQDEDPGGHDHGHGADHGHSHGTGHLGWLLLIPVLLLLFCAPPALDPSSSAGPIVQAAASASTDRQEYQPLPAGEAPAISLHDFQNRAVDDTASTLNRDVTVTAYVLHRAGRPLLGRVMIWCCVADARPIEIELVGSPDLPPDGAWVTAVIRLVPGTATRERRYTPQARLVTERRVPAPNPPYDY